MGILVALLVVWGFWVVVFVAMALLVRLGARGHDDEETVCELDDEYFASRQDRAPTHAV
jgi:hypothetical protein